MKTVVDLTSVLPYVPGADADAVARRYGLERVVKLASNEYPLPPVAGVRVAIDEALERLNRYPDAGAAELRGAIAAHYGLQPAQVAVGNGSLELLLLLGDALLAPGVEAVFPRGTFSLYRRLCDVHGATAIEVPLHDYSADLEAMLAAVGERTSLVVVCNPNNPTGTYLPAARLEAFLERLPGDVLLVVDEAYVEFCTESDADDVVALVARHDNLMVTRTFSKIYGLCALRIGYCLAAPGIVAALDTVRQPFNTNLIAQVAAREALRHQDEVAARRAATAELRRELALRLADLGLPSLPSQANFVFADVSSLGASTDVCERLMAAGAVVRDGAAFGLPGFVRISVGTRDENEFLIERMARAAKPPAPDTSGRST